MKDFHQSHTCRPTENEKKGRKIKNHFHPGENCKCFSPFVKVHHHNCPMVLKPCPIHGNEFYSEEKEQNVVISFHPSSKTEKLFQPIKSLLAHCNSGTKINFQYYSPSNSISKESVKTSYGQNTYNLKKNLNSNTFMEKTKSFVTEKTSKVKKLKQCFYSPCNSITQKTRSQTSIKERLNQILRDETKQTRNVFYNLVPEMPPDDKNWFYSNLGGLKNRDKLSDGKMESDFITVTQHDKNNVINHKIFEIKHNKGGKDVPFAGFPKQQTQFVYSSVNVGSSPIVQKTQTTPKQDQKEEGKRNNLDISNSEKTHRSVSSSSSGSVYITPFFFVPKGIRDSDSDSKQGKALKEEFETVDEAVQANDSNIRKPSLTTQETQTSPRQSQQLVPSKTSPTDNSNGEPKSKSVLLQTEFLNKSSKTSSEEFSEPQYASKTTVEEIYVNNERVYSQKRSRAVSEGTDSSQSRSFGVQAGASCLYKEVVISARWGSRTKDKVSQTEDNWNLQVSVKAIESKATKTKSSADKEIQTAVSQEDSENSEFLHLNSPNVTYVIKPFDELNSDQAIEKHAKTCWGKAHSDSDLYERMRCGCWKTDEDFVPQEEGIKDFDQEKKNPVTTTKIYECVATETETETVPKNGNVVLRTKETFERLAVTKETSTRDDTPEAVSDLSELKRIIQEVFERSNIPGKKTCNCIEKKPSADKKQEPETKVPKPLEEPMEKQTKNSEAQTDFRVLLNEAEQGKTGQQKVKLRYTAPADEENQTKTFYVCAVCGRDIVKYTVDVGTNTESPKKEDDVKKTSKKDEDEKKSNIDTYEITMKTKKVKAPKPKSDDTKPWKTYDSRDVSQPSSVHKTAIPVPVCAPPSRPKNTDKNFSKGRVCQLSEERKPKAMSSQNQKIPVMALMEDCICEDIPGPSTAPECVPQPKCYITQIPSTCSKPVEGRPNRKPEPNRDQGNTQNKRTNSDFNYCVLVAQSWPRDLFSLPPKDRGSNTLDDDAISGALNKKQSSEKDVARNTNKKIKEPTSCPMFEKSLSPKLLNTGKNGDIQIWFRGKPPCQEEDICEFNNGPHPTRESSPENLEELNEEFAELSDDDEDTPRGTSGLEEEEIETGEEEEREEEEAEIGERLMQLLRELPVTSSPTFQTHPPITINRSFHSNGPPTSKSLNRFSSSRQPKKKRIRKQNETNF